MEKNALSQVIIKAWQDQQFKEKLIKDPGGTLFEEGLEIQKGVKVIVCENTDSQVFLVVPQKPSEELSEEQLLAIAGGTDMDQEIARDMARRQALREKLRKKREAGG